MTASGTAPRDGAGRRSCHYQYLIRDPHSRHRPTLQPPNIGHNIRRVVDEITTANGLTNQVTHMVYSHHHADHQGASSLFGGDIVRIGHEETRRLLLRDDDPARPVPHVTLSDS
jgi:glyoxylase-like metal-dependent hydrolase (beta-lactamase superfamily II)